jgi:hypothetical protein
MRCDDGTLSSHFPRTLLSFCHFDKVTYNGTSQERKRNSEACKQNVIVPIIFPLYCGHNLFHDTTALASTASADPLEERRFYVAYSSSVSAPLVGDRNLENGVSPLLSYHKRGRGLARVDVRWASSKQGIALFTTIQPQR